MNRTAKILIGAAIAVGICFALAVNVDSAPNVDEALVEKVAQKAALNSAEYYGRVHAPRITVGRMDFPGEIKGDVKRYIGYASAELDGRVTVVSRGSSSMVLSVPVKAIVKSSEWDTEQKARLFVTVNGLRDTERGWRAQSEPFPKGWMANVDGGDIYDGRYATRSGRATIDDIDR